MQNFSAGADEALSITIRGVLAFTLLCKRAMDMRHQKQNHKLQNHQLRKIQEADQQRRILQVTESSDIHRKIL